MNTQDIKRLMEAYQSVVSEKAVSQQQQKLMGLALAYKRGEVSDDEISPEAKAMADKMSEKDLEDFAKTKHKGLPVKKEEIAKESKCDDDDDDDDDLEEGKYAIYKKGKVFDTFSSKAEAEDSLNSMGLSPERKKEYRVRKLPANYKADWSMKEEVELEEGPDYLGDIRRKKERDEKKKASEKDGETQRQKMMRKVYGKAMGGLKKEEVESVEESLNEELWKEIEDYAKKHGGIDKKDMMKVAMMLKKGDRKGAVKYARGLDTDPRDWLLDKMDEAMDPVDKKALKKDFDDRDDKDIDNDGDVDNSDKYLHKRRKAVGKAMSKDDKKDKKPEISKIDESFEELWSAIQEAAEPANRKKNATAPEGLLDKESPKSKEFIAKHKVDVEDEEPTHKTADAAGRATKPSKMRPGDNAAGDKKVVNPVKEDTRSMREKIMDVLSGKTWGEIKDEANKED